MELGGRIAGGGGRSSIVEPPQAASASGPRAHFPVRERGRWSLPRLGPQERPFRLRVRCDEAHGRGDDRASTPASTARSTAETLLRVIRTGRALACTLLPSGRRAVALRSGSCRPRSSGSGRRPAPFPESMQFLPGDKNPAASTRLGFAVNLVLEVNHRWSRGSRRWAAAADFVRTAGKSNARSGG